MPNTFNASFPSIFMEKQAILNKIKEKKELSSIPDSFILPFVEKHTPKNKELKKSDIKLIVSLVRSDLRRSTGMFQKSGEKLWKLRESLAKENKVDKLLETHLSTKERIQFYPKLKEIIFNLNPKSILDLGCGLNPLALASKEIKYYAVDIQQSDLDIVKQFFEKNNIHGKTINLDVSKSLSSLPEADLCLALKLLDLLPLKAQQAEKILSLNCKKFIFSFSTKTLSGKLMLHKKRLWLERVLHNKNIEFYTLSSDNEIFYIIEK